jgi:hypothetical protein
MRFLLAVLIVMLPTSASALDLNARLTASLHSWETQDTDSTSIAHNTIHQLLSLKIQDLGVKGLSFHTYGRGFVHTEGSDTRRRLALYSSYADWKGVANRLDLPVARWSVRTVTRLRTAGGDLDQICFCRMSRDGLKGKELVL